MSGYSEGIAIKIYFGSLGETKSYLISKAVIVSALELKNLLLVGSELANSYSLSQVTVDAVSYLGNKPINTPFPILTVVSAVTGSSTST